MKTLIVAATSSEIQPLLTHFNLSEKSFIELPKLDILITGVGMTATAFSLGQYLNNKYNNVLNLGIAGSFNKNIPLGNLVNTIQDTFAELGADAPNGFISIDELGFGKSTFNGISNAQMLQVKGITVSTVHGTEEGILEVRNRLQPDVESMEGAAVLYCCYKLGIPCLQIRSISNYVEPRNKDNWQIALAIKNLNNWAIEYLSKI